MTRSLRIMTYNIHGGRDDDFMARGAEVIRASEADIIGVQEVRRNFGVPNEDNLGDLARRLGYAHAYAPIDFLANFTRGEALINGGELKPGQRAYGDAILSQLPIRRAKAFVHSFFPPPDGKWKEYRDSLHAEIELGGGQDLQFFTCHLSTNRNELPVQCREVIEFANSIPGARIITGDFNTQPNDPHYAELTRGGFADAWVEKGSGDGFTMRPERPCKRIDYILYQPGGQLRLKSIRVGDAGVSDHMPVIADFEFAD